MPLYFSEKILYSQLPQAPSPNLASKISTEIGISEFPFKSNRRVHLGVLQPSPSYCSQSKTSGSHANADILALILCQCALLLSRLLLFSWYTKENSHLFSSWVDQVPVYQQNTDIEYEHKISQSLGGLKVEASIFFPKEEMPLLQEQQQVYTLDSNLQCRCIFSILLSTVHH